MLQQTQVKTVLPYWERWMRALPDVHALARASPATLHKLWEGLGYYARVRNLQRAARRIVRQHGGRLPERFDSLLALPGVGQYTAGAIASIAFDQPQPALDGNAARVLTRLFGLPGDPRHTTLQSRLRQRARELVEAAATLQDWTRPCSQFNQALMELGARVCLPRSPRCDQCPWRRVCAALRTGRPEAFGLRRRAAPPLRRTEIVLLVGHRGRFLVRQRPADGVNAHLWELPNTALPANAKDARLTRPRIETALWNGQATTRPAPGHALLTRPVLVGALSHSITRHRLRLQIYRTELTGRPPRWPGRWLTPAQLRGLPLAGAHRKILARFLPG